MDVFETIETSIEKINKYKTDMQPMLDKHTKRMVLNPEKKAFYPWETHITLTLYQYYYELDIKYDELENNILLRLPASTGGICNPLKEAFSELCNAIKFNFELTTRFGPTIHLPDWLLQWMRESRSMDVTDHAGTIRIRLKDADAIRTLVALLVVDLSKESDVTVYSVEFYPQNLEQISLYLETITKNNTLFGAELQKDTDTDKDKNKDKKKLKKVVVQGAYRIPKVVMAINRYQLLLTDRVV